MEQAAQNWQVMEVLVFILGFVLTITVPIIRLVRTLTILNATLKDQGADLLEMQKEGKELHQTIASKLENHEGRIREVELEMKHLQGKGS